MTMSDCPPESTLRLLGTEAIGVATLARLEEHVEHCSDCQEFLDAVTRAIPRGAPSAPAPNTLVTLPGLVIEHALGRGGGSVVYLAREPALERHVAVKLFPRNPLVDPHARDHWLAEARALSRVPHDHVVAIHRVEEAEDWLCLIIEYVPGGTLKERLTEPLTPRDAARLIEIIARAVGYFHTRGVCHLDLKPSNILLDGEPGAPWDSLSPKISDFGIARLEGEPGATETGANGPQGTPSYMAPEQVAALPGTIGPAADLHALGALLYHLLTGRPPFQGASTAETLEQVRNQDPVPPRQLNGRIARDLETICLTCLEKVPSRRYQTAEAMAGDLRLWLEGRPIKARRVSPMERAWRWCRRHPAVAGLLITLALTLATGVVGLLVLLNQAKAERMRLAEARRHAEAYEQFSASTADQLSLFLRTTILLQRNATAEQMIAALLKLRRSASALKNRGILPSSTIGILEQEIAWSLSVYNRPDEARELLKEAIEDLKQSAAKNPKDKETQDSLAAALGMAGTLAHGAGQLEDALDFYEQEAAANMTARPGDLEYNGLTNLYMKLQVLADRPGESVRPAQKERARRLSQQILRYLLGPDFQRSMDPSGREPETLGRLLKLYNHSRISYADSKQSDHAYQAFVGMWLLHSVGPLCPLRSASSLTQFDRDPEAGASALCSALRERCSKLGLEDSMVPAAIQILSNHAYGEAAEDRRLGRIEDARATATRLLTIARRVVREYPDSAHSHRVLSEAYNQVKKNAMKTGDDKLVVEALIEAIEAAQRALVLDPYQTVTRSQLEKLTKQLADMETVGARRVPRPGNQ
jgi:tRNA A-37 threonylcarbamoyl transferase component Bud32/tetratricopeptide (TPR) repeat protein